MLIAMINLLENGYTWRQDKTRLVSSTTAQSHIQAHVEAAISVALHPAKVWEQFVDDLYSILKPTHLGTFFHHISNQHQNI